MYFAAPDARELALLREEGANHILLAFGSPGFRGTMDRALSMGFHVLLDSGAYSAFTRGRRIDIADYAACLKDYAGLVDAYVTLDVCDDPVATERNQDWLEERGYAPMPVWHFGEPETVLRRLVDRGYGYIGLGNSIVSAHRPQERFYDWVHETTARYPSVRFHGFGVGALEPRLMLLYSTDSTSWQRAARFGQQIGRFGVVKGERYGLFWNREELLRHNIRALLWQREHTSLPGCRILGQTRLLDF